VSWHENNAHGNVFVSLTAKQLLCTSPEHMLNSQVDYPWNLSSHGYGAKGADEKS